MSRQQALEESWKITRTHLDAARRLLPAKAVSACASLADYEDYLSHNELEMAFDILEDIAAENAVPLAFWSELERAAWNMSLTRKVPRCQQRLRDAITFDLSANPDVHTEVKQLMDKHTTIPAIKALRQATGCDLRAAKIWVDGYWEQSNPKSAPMIPCPYCAKPLRTIDAKQCFACGMDWHDPTNVVRNG